jgi:hypothetical protein
MREVGDARVGTAQVEDLVATARYSVSSKRLDRRRLVRASAST